METKNDKHPDHAANPEDEHEKKTVGSRLKVIKKENKMMMGFGLMGVIFVIILVVVLIVAFVGLRPNVYQGKDQRSEPPSETPREILEKRYARGEIDKDEFDRIRKDI